MRTDSLANKYQNGERSIGNIGRVEPRSSMHALVPAVLADVCMPVKVNDANIALYMRCQPSNIRVANRMIPAKDNWKDRPLMHIADRFGDLVKTLLDVRRYHIHVSNINHVERFHEIDAQ